MKLDWKLIKSILQTLESAESPNPHIRHSDIYGFDAQAVAYHMDMLSSAGLIKLYGTPQVLHDGSGNYGSVIAKNMTLAGHKLLNSLADESRWSKVLAYFSTTGAEMSLAAAGRVAETLTDAVLGISQ